MCKIIAICVCVSSFFFLNFFVVLVGRSRRYKFNMTNPHKRRREHVYLLIYNANSKIKKLYTRIKLRLVVCWVIVSAYTASSRIVFISLVIVVVVIGCWLLI